MFQQFAVALNVTMGGKDISAIYHLVTAARSGLPLWPETWNMLLFVPRADFLAPATCLQVTVGQTELSTAEMTESAL